MANQHHNGGRHAAPEDRSSWRPQDRDRDDRDDDWRDRYRERDPRRWEGSRGSEVGYGQGQSGYSAGRHADDRAQRVQNRNDPMPSPGSFEDRSHDLGVDDRFTGRGRSAYWQDRASDPDHHTGHGRDGDRMRDERSGYHDSQPQRMGYSSAPRGEGYGSQRPQATQDGFERAGATHRHRGTGPHRGKGPVGYQRSDERLREAVCEALADDDDIDASHIEVVVRNAEVTLSGVVDDRRAKRDAEDCAYSISGVRDVQNLLRVKDDPARNPTS